MSETESAIRNYLTYLRDPESLRDEDEIVKLREQVESAVSSGDAIAEWKARTELKRAEEVDGTAFRDAFIDHAKQYVDEQDLDPSVLGDMGVPAADLKSAGLVSMGRSTTAPGDRQRRSRVTIEDVKAAVPSTGNFTSRDLEDKTGASYGTIRKALAELVRDKVITDEGADAEHSGRGRAPVVYRKT
ncbi:MAG: hypothetical protein R2707_16485 [Acidimicrobiales bacterium]